MSVSVFFSNKNIQIVVGKSKGKSIYIDRLIESPMPENAILNGVIIEGGGEAISAKLKELWSVNKISGNADLIINSPQLISNRITMPIISKQTKVTEYLEKQTNPDEFGRFDSPLKGWYLIGHRNRSCRAHLHRNVHKDFLRCRHHSQFRTRWCKHGHGATRNMHQRRYSHLYDP